MRDSLIMRIVISFLGFILILFPVALQAIEIDSSFKEIEPGEPVAPPSQMTQKQMDDLFGEDPYLGQTSYLQFPDGFKQREKSK